MTGTWHPRAPDHQRTVTSNLQPPGDDSPVQNQEIWRRQRKLIHLWSSLNISAFEGFPRFWTSLEGRRTKWVAHKKKIAFQTAWDVPTFPNVQSPKRRISTSVSPPLDEDAPLYGLSEHLSVSHVLGMNDSIWAPKPRVTWLYGLISLCFIHTIYFLSENHSDLASPASTMLIASKWTSRWQMEIKPGKWTQIPLDMMYQWALGLGCVDAVQDLVHSAAGMAGLSSGPRRRRRKNQLDAVSDWSSAPPATIPTHSPGDPNTSLQHPISGEDVSNSTHDQSGAVWNCWDG